MKRHKNKILFNLEIFEDRGGKLFKASAQDFEDLETVLKEFRSKLK
jgi:hypothetical protein